MSKAKTPVPPATSISTPWCCPAASSHRMIRCSALDPRLMLNPSQDVKGRKKPEARSLPQRQGNNERDGKTAALSTHDANPALAHGRHGPDHAVHRRDNGGITGKLSLADINPPAAGNIDPDLRGNSFCEPDAERIAAVSSDDVAS